MAYKALYRKYRPNSFDNVVGQDVIIKILRNSITLNKIGHAYLFSGPRGVGKTSIAKIFAKTVNCLNNQDGISCNECKNCKIINERYTPDIIEIDAASNNGVDEIREIRNNVNIVPSELKYKIYIIDEVHMLSSGAFNALLKTLEEPPENIIFILATTDVQKVPATIVSRCQCFNFNRIDPNYIVPLLKNICKKEDIKVEDKILKEISILSEGGLRDAIGMLDKLNAYSNSNITYEDFEKINGIVSYDKKIGFINKIYCSDSESVINTLDNIYNSGKSIEILIADIISILKDKTIDYYVHNNKEYNINFLLDLSNTLVDLINNNKNSSKIKLSLEIKLLAFMNKNINNVSRETLSTDIVDNSTQNDISTKFVDKKNDEEETKIISQEIISNENDLKYQDLAKDILNNCFARASKQNKNLFMTKWKTLSDYSLDSDLGCASNALIESEICVVGEKEVTIALNHESEVNRCYNLIDQINKLFDKIYGCKYDIAFITSDDWKKAMMEYKKDRSKYVYKELSNPSKKKVSENIDNGEITGLAYEIFGNDVIKVE